MLPIYVRDTSNKERIEWRCQRNCDPNKWNRQSGRATGNKEAVKELNKYLDATQANIFEVQKEYALRSEPVTAIQVRNKILNQNDEKAHTLIEVYQYHNDQFEQLVGAEYSCGTFKKFKSALKSLREFLERKFNKKDVYLTDANHKF